MLMGTSLLLGALPLPGLLLGCSATAAAASAGAAAATGASAIRGVAWWCRLLDGEGAAPASLLPSGCSWCAPGGPEAMPSTVLSAAEAIDASPAAHSPPNRSLPMMQLPGMLFMQVI
jgi:hypothetical protein